jgi:hypothetical protein
VDIEAIIASLIVHRQSQALISQDTPELRALEGQRSRGLLPNVGLMSNCRFADTPLKLRATPENVRAILLWKLVVVNMQNRRKGLFSFDS